MNPQFTLTLTIIITLVALARADQSAKSLDAMADCPMHAQHASDVDARGDKGMGFSHAKTTHHFRITSDGGIIEVTANDPADTTSRDQIRQHLTHIAAMFSNGNFEIPMFVHDTMPPGAATMQEMKSQISYTYGEIENGGRVLLKTSDAKAVAAIHDFLRFQINEHRTGDSLQAAAK